MKTIHDYLNIICGGYKSPLYTMLTNYHDPARLTICGRMLYISVEMIFGGEY